MLFSKKITTVKADPFAEMQSAISDAINAALKAGVRPAAIQQELENHAADFRRAEEARIEARRANPMPTMYDPVTFQPIDAHGEAARREEKRIAEELRRQQAEYAADVDRRGREDARRRGEVL